jgi:hypothetical protein
MKNKEYLSNFINGVINGNNESAQDAWKSYITTKAREMTGVATKEPINEWIDIPSESRITLHGDKVFLDNKPIGYIHNDISDINSGIDFISYDKKFSKEFNTLEDLYAYLNDAYVGEK